MSDPRSDLRRRMLALQSRVADVQTLASLLSNDLNALIVDTLIADAAAALERADRAVAPRAAEVIPFPSPAMVDPLAAWSRIAGDLAMPVRHGSSASQNEGASVKEQAPGLPADAAPGLGEKPGEFVTPRPGPRAPAVADRPLLLAALDREKGEPGR